MTTAVISYAQVETYSQPTEHDNWQAMLRYIVRLCDAKDFVDLADKQILCKLVTAARNDVIHSHSTRCIEAIFQALAARGKKAYAKRYSGMYRLRADGTKESLSVTKAKLSSKSAKSLFYQWQRTRQDIQSTLPNEISCMA